MNFEFVWLAVGVAVLAIEAFTLFRKEPGDTFSEQIWKWSCTNVWRGFVYAVLIWLVYHFIVETVLPWDWTGTGIDDVFLVVVSFAIGFSAPTPRWRTKCEEKG